MKTNELIGKKIKMNSGEYATCISYRKPLDIDIQFEDETIITTSKYLFLDGAVKNPNFWIGKSNKMNNGQIATIIAYRGYYDIDVQFEDGTVVKSKAIDKFKTGSITSPNCNSSTKASCLNQKVKQNNGQTAICIAYRSNTDIDIQFEDGTIVKHKQKNSFLNGRIRNPNFNKFSVAGKSVMQNCGMKATCISDRGGKDIDVQFEDGTVVKHRYRKDFLEGIIQNHNIYSCLDMVVEMHNGQKAKCIKYVSSNDIDVEFEDGTIVEHTRKDYFVKGSLENPNYNPTSCLGETRVMINGQKAVCIAYRKSNDIDVQFEDGTIVCQRQKASFLKGEISNPNYDPYSCLNEEKIMNCGMKAKCIRYGTSEDIDVQFEDGTIVTNKTKSCFYNGSIGNPNVLNGSLPEQIIYYIIKKHFKEVEHNFRPNWLKNPKTKSNLEIDIWIPSLKVGVEYDGVKWHKQETQKSKMKAELISKSNEIARIYTFLEKGSIVHTSNKHINYQFESTSNAGDLDNLYVELQKYLNILLNELGIKEDVILTSELLDKIKSSKIIKEEFKAFEPETYVMNCGMKATLVAYRRSNNIDIEFEDGTIVMHTKLDSFRKGNVAHPNIDKYAIIKNRSSCLGKSVLQKCGLIGKCIAYRKADDIDIQFEDGTVVTKKSKEKFLKGNVGYPVEKKYLYQTKTMNCGEKATIIVYRKYIDIDVQFEDGTIVKNRKTDEFLNGSISNPNKK